MKTRLNKILSIILVAVMLVTAAPLSGFVGLNIEKSSFSTKASATTFLSEQEAERFLSLFLEAGSTSWEAAENALTGKEEGSSETWRMIGEGVESFADLTADIDWVEIIPTGSTVSGATISYITGAASGVLQIFDSYNKILDDNSSMQKSINGFRLIEGLLKFVGKGSLVPSTLSIVLTTIDVALDIASFLEKSYFQEAVELYGYELLIQSSIGEPLTRKIAPEPDFWESISQEEAQYIYDSIFFKYYCQQRVDTVGAGSGSGSGGGNVDIPAEYIEMLVYSYELLVGETINNPATVYPTNATNRSVTYSSSNTSVATVDSNGNITAKGGGSANIIVTASNGVSNYCEITVYPFKVSIVNGTYQIDKYVDSGGDVVIPDSIRGIPVTTIGEKAFYWCDSLTSVTIGNSVTTIGDYAFYPCDSLTSVTIGNSVTAIGDSAFECCYGLTSLEIPDSVITIGDSAFRYCRGLTSIAFGNGVTAIGDYAFDHCDSLIDVIIPDNVTTIGDSAFETCDKLASVTIGNGVTTIGTHAFWACDSLISIIIGNSVATIGSSAFGRCLNLNSIIVNNENQCFSNDSNGVLYDKNKSILIQYPIGNERTSFSIPDSVTKIWAFAFRFCDTLERVVIPDSVTSIGDDAFYDCDGITSIVIPDKVTTIGGYAFCDCSNLLNISIPGDIVDIGCSPFDRTAYYENPENWEDGLVYLDNYLLGSLCEYYFLDDEALPEAVYEIKDGTKYIVEGAFRMEYYMEGVVIPVSVISIGGYAFGEMLSNVYYKGGEDQWDKVVISPDNEYLFNATMNYSHIHTICDWRVAKTPTTTETGVKLKKCTGCSLITERVKLPATGFELINGATIDFAYNIISGFEVGSTSFDSYTTLVSDNYAWNYETSDGRLGTGAKAILKDGKTVIGEYTVTIFGDVNGDGWYDGTDSIIVSCLANGLLTQDSVSEAVYRAADCNHDGVIESFDVAILEQAGLLLANVDQSKSNEELATDEAFIEYLDLIDQTPDEEDVEDEVIETPEVETEEEFDFIEFIITIIKKFFEFLRSTLPIK